jgi:hypothetical protein
MFVFQIIMLVIVIVIIMNMFKYVFSKLNLSERLRWSRGCVLAFSTQVCGFKPGRSRRIFQGEKILTTTSIGPMS